MTCTRYVAKKNPSCEHAQCTSYDLWSGPCSLQELSRGMEDLRKDQIIDQLPLLCLNKCHLVGVFKDNAKECCQIENKSGGMYSMICSGENKSCYYDVLGLQ